jgi:hypothetical protein
MNVIKSGLFITILTLSTAAFAASDNSISGAGQGAAANQPNAATEQMGGATKMQEGRAANSDSDNSPQNAPTGVGGQPSKIGTPASPNYQGN